MNPQPVLFTSRLVRLSGTKRSRSGGHVTRMGKSEMQKILFLLDCHRNKWGEKRMRMDLRETGCRVHWDYSRLPFTVLVQLYNPAMEVRSDVSHGRAAVGTTNISHTNSTTARIDKFPATTFCSMAPKFSAQLPHSPPPLFPVALRPNAGHGLLILEVSRSHTTTHHSR